VFFDNVSGLLRVMIVGTLAYGTLVVFLRVSGNRTLSKMNAFDLIVTVALGSTLATILLSDRVALAEGIVAFAVLIGLQYGVTWLWVRSSAFSDLVKATPILLFFNGQYLRDQMRHARVVESELLAAVRSQGIASLKDVQAVVLEADGSFNTIGRTSKECSAFDNLDLPGFPRKRQSRHTA
jgi:uncharacterized membrane protein YcaP (DUF421 family)